MKTINIFCFGFGQVAKSFIRKLSLENININLSATSREKSQKKKIDTLSYDSFQFDENTYDQKLINKLTDAEHILVSIAPIDGQDIVLKKFQKNFCQGKYKWVTYLSATSVYGDHKGEWVDEKSATMPTSENGVNRLSVEKSWMNTATKNNLPFQIFRLSGIYSNKKNILVRLKTGEEKIINKENHFFSRIHVEDIANTLFRSITDFKTKEIYNISDDKPCSSFEVASYAAKLLDIKKLEIIDLSVIKSQMLKNFYKDSKKVSNQKMKKFFNYELKYPTYIEGLNYIRDNFI